MKMSHNASALLLTGCDVSGLEPPEILVVGAWEGTVLVGDRASIPPSSRSRA